MAEPGQAAPTLEPVLTPCGTAEEPPAPSSEHVHAQKELVAWLDARLDGGASDGPGGGPAARARALAATLAADVARLGDELRAAEGAAVKLAATAAHAEVTAAERARAHAVRSSALLGELEAHAGSRAHHLASELREAQCTLAGLESAREYAGALAAVDASGRRAAERAALGDGAGALEAFFELLALAGGGADDDGGGEGRASADSMRAAGGAYAARARATERAAAAVAQAEEEGAERIHEQAGAAVRVPFERLLELQLGVIRLGKG
ncbi:hypothetical protein T492DRAFT_916054 [Pavlovales sp. CCMP2436]|nr:hypothetical protein T492DRAFT_916054 [Pavlovales sp. CCMP2436]